MDINANSSPAISATNGVKSPNSQQKNARSDDDQIAVVPFQAVLENQQPKPKKNQADDQSIENTDNQTRVSLTQNDALQSNDSEMLPSEHAIDQLNYSRNLLHDGKQTTLQTQLLNHGEPSVQKKLTHLNQSIDSQIQQSGLTQFSDEQQSVLVPFVQATQRINGHSTMPSEMDSKKPELSVPMQLASEEELPILSTFIQNEQEDRGDQPLFSLNNDREIPTKKLSQDFIPLYKTLTDKESPSVAQMLSTTHNSINVKSALTPSIDGNASQVMSNHSFTTQTVSMMPAPTITQAAIANAPIAQMQPGVPLGNEAWQQQLNQHLLFFSRQGISHAQIRLHPEELGSLNVHLRIEDNQAVMHFVSPHSQVRAAMETMMPILRNALQESGINLTQGSVGQDNLNHSSDSNGQTGKGHENHLHAGSALGGIAGGDASIITQAQSTIRARGGIDTFA
ncbi:flagellar hook-length control protein FliK [Providencia burhodogranariea]|uniref:Flagellar hook-length control protein n=1 Tax=Providencia burhodogranariea DSM 19968 TaxID=1141662 RepID=K8WQG7_9GAMM|nr:flagellar hook-length control protein FliK [Providencia burhodogranariea]EKT62211.1 flagellar hook-length control protein [Providencia burhodogranariea DSM 19968]